MELLCELYEAQVARGLFFVHELTSEVNSKMTCVTKIMAMPGSRTVGADLCMFGLAACDEGAPGFVNARSPTRDKLGCGMQSQFTGTHRHAQHNRHKGNKREHGYVKLPE